MQTDRPAPVLGYRDIFLVFFRCGLAFGGGLGILGELENELVTRRGVITRQDLLTLYGLSRAVPSGTMSAIAVAIGYRFGGLLGTVIALVGLVLPGLTATILLTMAYGVLRDGPVFTLMADTLLPAALALLLVAAIRLGRDVFRPGIDLVIALAGFAGMLLHWNPSFLLIAGGVAGLLVSLTGKWGDR